MIKIGGKMLIIYLITCFIFTCFFFIYAYVKDYMNIGNGDDLLSGFIASVFLGLIWPVVLLIIVLSIIGTIIKIIKKGRNQ